MGRLLHYLRSVLTHSAAQLLGADDRKRPWQGFAAVLAVGSPWGHPRVPQGGKPSSPRGKWESWWSRASSPLRAGNKSEPIRGSSMTFRGQDCPILKCSSAKKRTEWRIASACLLLGIVGGRKVYLCRCCFSHLHPDNIFRFLSSSRLKWPGSLSPCFEASTSQLLLFHRSKVLVSHSSHVVCALRIRDASEGDDVGGHQGVSESLLAYGRRIIRWDALRVSNCIFTPLQTCNPVMVLCKHADLYMPPVGTLGLLVAS